MALSTSRAPLPWCPWLSLVPVGCCASGTALRQGPHAAKAARAASAHTSDAHVSSEQHQCCRHPTTVRPEVTKLGKNTLLVVMGCDCGSGCGCFKRWLKIAILQSKILQSTHDVPKHQPYLHRSMPGPTGRVDGNSRHRNWTPKTAFVQVKRSPAQSYGERVAQRKKHHLLQDHAAQKASA